MSVLPDLAEASDRGGGGEDAPWEHDVTPSPPNSPKREQRDDSQTSHGRVPESMHDFTDARGCSNRISLRNTRRHTVLRTKAVTPRGEKRLRMFMLFDWPPAHLTNTSMLCKSF